LRFLKIYLLENFGRAALRRKLSAAAGLAAADEKPNFSRWRRRPKSYRRTAAAGARRLDFGLCLRGTFACAASSGVSPADFSKPTCVR
jgi:hypothetical protein